MQRERERRHQIPCAGDGEKRRMDMEVNKSENVIYRRNISNIILDKTFFGRSGNMEWA